MLAKKDKELSAARIEARISPELKNLLMSAAKMQGTSLTNFLIFSAKKEASAILKQQTLISLTMRDAKLFADSLLQDVSPNDRLKSAAEKYSKSVNL